MKTLSSPILAALVAVAGPLAPAAAQSLPSADLRTLCPGAEQALQAELARAWHEVGYPATLRVQMRVDGRRVVLGPVSGGVGGHRHAVTRAVGRLDCASTVAGGERVDFEVRFTAPGESQAPTRLAGR
ncbi:MAG: hypothetical protein QM750_12790 [Rubrivivax sp.]